MITKNVKLYLGDGFPVRIPVSQYDTMWQFVFTIIHNSQPWQIPTGATAVLNGKKPDGNVFAFSGTIENNTVTVDADVQMTACAGDTICELSILDDGKTVGTANFTLAVESAPNSTGETPSASDVDAYGAIVSGELDTYFEQHPEMIEGKGLSEPIRLAILNCFRHVAWVDEHGSDYYNALYDLLMNKEVMSITAVFTQESATIYTTDSIDTLKQYLVVTASYDDGTTGEVTAYELSGTLTAGTSTITVSYGGKTTTFNVTVTAWTLTWSYLDGGLPANVAPNDWIVVQNTANVTFETGKGIKYTAKSPAFNIRPNDYQYTENGAAEIVVNFETLDNDHNVRVTLGTSTNCIIGFIGKNGIRINSSTNNPIPNTSISANTDYTLRVERTASNGKVYLDGNLVYSGELRSLAQDNNILAGVYDTTTVIGTFYIKSIKFYQGS